MKTLINTKYGFNLYKPYHCWDTNYHLIDTVEEIEYLIDIHDVIDDENYTIEDYEENYVKWSDVRNMDDISLLIYVSWLTKKL